MSRRRWMLWIALVAVLASCGQAGDGAAGTVPGGDDLDRLRPQARDALARYDKAVAEVGSPRFVPVGELTGQRGDWEPANEENKASLAAGRVVVAGALPAASNPTGEVVWATGARKTFPLISAGEALDQLTAAGTGDCPGCATLQVTGARLTATPIQTTRGPAMAPAWEYSLNATAVRVTRVAVAGSAIVKVTPPSWDPYNPPGGLAIDSATTTARGRQLTVTFTGSPSPASRPCGADYGAEAIESANAVVVIVVAHPHAADEACSAIGAPRTTTVDLAAPLGERAVLEVQLGLPVPVTVIR